MAWVVAVALGGISLLWIGWNLTLDALWQPTDGVTVRRLLQLAELKAGERLLDLGCGDGRFVIVAAKEFGARAHGVEIDPFRVLIARLGIRWKGVSRKASVVQGNMYVADVSQADVVVLFLSATANFRLQKRLQQEMKPGARVVSYYHPMWGWRPDLVGESRDGYPIYVYRIGETLGHTAG